MSRYDPNLLQNNTFIANTAIKSGGALKLLFQYQELNPVENDTSVYINNTDSKGQALHEGKLSTYRLSFYNVLVNDKVQNDQDLDLWVSNSSLTVSSI